MLHWFLHWFCIGFALVLHWLPGMRCWQHYFFKNSFHTGTAIAFKVRQPSIFKSPRHSPRCLERPHWFQVRNYRSCCTCSSTTYAPFEYQSKANNVWITVGSCTHINRYSCFSSLLSLNTHSYSCLFLPFPQVWQTQCWKEVLGTYSGSRWTLWGHREVVPIISHLVAGNNITGRIVLLLLMVLLWCWWHRHWHCSTFYVPPHSLLPQRGPRTKEISAHCQRNCLSGRNWRMPGPRIPLGTWHSTSMHFL